MRSFLLTLCLLWSTNATITILDTGERLPSVLDDPSLEFAYARLQMVHAHANLCGPDYKGKYNLTIPLDNLPIALLIKPGLCTLEEQLLFLQHHVRYHDLVQFLIFGERSIDAEETELQQQAQDSEDDDELWEQRLAQQLLQLNHSLSISRVTYKSMYRLERLVQENMDERHDGGPEIRIDNHKSTLNGNTALTIGILSLVLACCCSCWFVSAAPEYEPPSNDQVQRPTRTRLTKQQVRDMLPVYQFDGETVVAQDGLELELDDCCSICMDDYESGDRLRVLPCRHAFHSRCVGRWLAERSSTCPLCKLDLLPEEEEEEEEEGGGDEASADAQAGAPEDAAQEETPATEPETTSSSSFSWNPLTMWRRRRSNATNNVEQSTPVESQNPLTEPLLSAEDREEEQPPSLQQQQDQEEAEPDEEIGQSTSMDSIQQASV